MKTTFLRKNGFFAALAAIPLVLSACGGSDFSLAEGDALGNTEEQSLNGRGNQRGADCYYTKSGGRVGSYGNCDCVQNTELGTERRYHQVSSRNECREIEQNYRSAGGILASEQPSTPPEEEKPRNKTQCDFVKSEYLADSDKCQCVDDNLYDNHANEQVRLWEVDSRGECRDIEGRYRDAGGILAYESKNLPGKPR